MHLGDQWSSALASWDSTTATTARGPRMPSLMPMPSTATTGTLTTDTDTDMATLTVDITAIPMPTTDTMATARSKPAWISSSRFVRFEDLAAVKLVKYLVTC